MSDGCCAKGTKFTVKSVFILLNLVVILFSLLLVIYQIVNTVTDFGDSWNDDIASILNVSTVAVSTFMVVSTLLASFFSALAAYGMEAANFRRYWDDPIFEICCCNLLKLKMMIYILVTGIGGIALVVVVILLQTNVIYVDINDQLTNYQLGSCNDIIADIVKPLQTPNKCCGTNFNTTSCGNWENNAPIGCECTDSVDQADANICMSAAVARSDFSCAISDDSVFIYKNDCRQAVIDTYFSGFTVVYAVGYILGGILLIACCLGSLIFVKGGN